MRFLSKHIILIGFKHVGKSVIGKHLAKQLKHPFVDLDQSTELLYYQRTKKNYTCREIMQQEGEIFFRFLEQDALCEIFNQPRSIIALGGGTTLFSYNPFIHKLIQSGIVIHIIAQRSIVWKRILMSGRPAFLKPGKNLKKNFRQRWNERKKMYKKISNFSIENDRSVDKAVNQVINQLHQKNLIF